MITAGFLISLSGVSAGIGLAVAALERTSLRRVPRGRQGIARALSRRVASWD